MRTRDYLVPVTVTRTITETIEIRATAFSEEGARRVAIKAARNIGAARILKSAGLPAQSDCFAAGTAKEAPILLRPARPETCCA
jgi:hypothetical protein